METAIDHVMSRCEIAGPAPEDRILEAERALGVRFPPSYRAFLAQYGAALGPGVRIAGLFAHPDPDQPPYWDDVLSLNLQTRRATRGAVPFTHIAISTDGGDYLFYLDARLTTPDSPVVVLGPGAESVVVAATFDDFVVRLANASLAF